MRFDELDKMKRLVSALYPDLKGVEPTFPEKEGEQGFVLLYYDRVINTPQVMGQ